jgi:excisionase family DNA binding protein
MARRKEPPERIQVWWDNPPGPDQGITFERTVGSRVYSWRVGPHGLLNMTEAALALGMSRMHLYRLVQDGKVKAKTRRGSMRIPLSEVKRLRFGRHRPSGPWLVG